MLNGKVVLGEAGRGQCCPTHGPAPLTASLLPVGPRMVEGRALRGLGCTGSRQEFWPWTSPGPWGGSAPLQASVSLCVRPAGDETDDDGGPPLQPHSFPELGHSPRAPQP